MTVLGSSDRNNTTSVHLRVNAHKVCVSEFCDFAIFAAIAIVAAINETQYLPCVKLLKRKRSSAKTRKPLQTHALKIS